MHRKNGAVALSYPPRVRVRAPVKFSATFLHDESSIKKEGYESAIAPKKLRWHIYVFSIALLIHQVCR